MTALQAPPAPSADIDAVRDYWNRRPCNIRHSPREVGTREYFDEVEARKYFVEPHIPGFADFAHWRGKKVLEIGCGIGTDTVNFARAGAEITAVDVSQASLDLARKRFEVFGLEGRFYVADAEHLSATVPVEPYDLIYSFGVIHHTPHPERVIAELEQYCGPNTELRLMLYSKWSWKVLWILLASGKGAFWRLGDLIRTHSEAETGCPVTYVYSPGGVRRLLDGFTVSDIRKEHVFPYQVAKYVKYEYERRLIFRLMPRWMVRSLERHLGWHTLVRARPLPPFGE